MNESKQNFLAVKKIAVVGVSATRGFGNTIYEELKRKGYTVYPVSRTAELISGDRCFPNLESIPDQIEGVVAVIPPVATEKLVEQCGKLGIGKLWIQPGAESERAITLAESNGIDTISHSCILMYAKPTSVHKPHVWLWKLLGKY